MTSVTPTKRGRPSIPDELKKQKVKDVENPKPKGRPRKPEEDKRAARREYEREYYKKNAEHLTASHNRWYAERMKLYNVFLANMKEKENLEKENINEENLNSFTE